MKLPGTDEAKTPDGTGYTTTPTGGIEIEGPGPRGGTFLKGSSFGKSELSDHLAPAKFFNVKEIQTRLDPFRLEIEGLAKIVDEFEIKNEADFERSAEMTGQAKKINKAIDSAVRAVVDDYFNFYKSGLNMGKALTNIVDTRILAALGPKQNAFAYEKELARREAEKKAKAEAEAFQKRLDASAKKKKVEPVKMQTAPVVKVETGPVKTQSGSMTSKFVWDFEFIDYKTKPIFNYVLKVCAGEYIKVAQKAIAKMVKAGIHEGISGVRFFERADTKHRAR